MVSGHRFDAQTLHSFIQAVFRQMGSEEQEAKSRQTWQGMIHMVLA